MPDNQPGRSEDSSNGIRPKPDVKDYRNSTVHTHLFPLGLSPSLPNHLPVNLAQTSPWSSR